MSANRLFVALVPPPDVVAAIDRFDRPELPGVRWVPPAQWHITLRFLGDADAAAVIAALSKLRHDPVHVELGPAVDSFGNGRVVVLPAAGCDSLAAEVRMCTDAVSDHIDEHQFAGHLTLARCAGDAESGLIGMPFSGGFVAQAVVLVRSRLGPTGASHRPIAVLPLD